MKDIIFPIILLLFISNAASAQQAGYPSSVYHSATGRERSAQEVEAMKRIYDHERSNAQFDRLSSVSDAKYRGDNFGPYDPNDPSNFVKKAMRYVTPSAVIRDQNQSFLKLPKTGIVKLLPEKACVANESDNKTNINKLVERCPFSFIPGHARYFSFRKGDYVRSAWADIGYADIGNNDNWIFTLGTFNQGILVNLGNISLEDVTLTTKGIAQLAGLNPSTQLDEAEKQYKQFDDGINVDGLAFQHILPIELERTYGLRVTAYKADFLQKWQTPFGNINIDPIKADRREDIIVAFRILEIDRESGLTLLWREIQRSKAPKLTIPTVKNAEKGK